MSAQYAGIYSQLGDTNNLCTGIQYHLVCRTKLFNSIFDTQINTRLLK